MTASGSHLQPVNSFLGPFLAPDLFSVYLDVFSSLSQKFVYMTSSGFFFHLHVFVNLANLLSVVFDLAKSPFVLCFLLQGLSGWFSSGREHFDYVGFEAKICCCVVQFLDLQTSMLT